MTDADHEAFREQMGATAEALREALAEDLGGDPDDYCVDHPGLTQYTHLGNAHLVGISASDMLAPCVSHCGIPAMTDEDDEAGMSQTHEVLANESELEFDLRRLLYRYIELLEYHPWPSEHERWSELAFSLLTRVGDTPEADVRMAIDELDALGYLETSLLKQEHEMDGGAISRRMIDVLEDAGFTTEAAERGVRTLREAARSLDSQFDGKVQRYLRQHGERMLSTVPEEFSFSALDPEEVEFAFRYWIQNVLAMPVDLPLESVDAFAAEHNATRADVLAAADRLDVNVALLTDILTQHELDATTEAEQ